MNIKAALRTDRMCKALTGLTVQENEFLRLFPEAREVFADGIERSIQRRRNQKRQRKTYSGKKKMHTRKSVVISDSKRRVLVLTKQKSGRRHGKRLADKEHLFTS